MEFSKVKIDYNRRARIPYNKDLAPEIRVIKAKFEAVELDLVEVFEYKLFRDYLYFYGQGVQMKAQRQKIQEAILKYGKDSLFWSELELTKKERKDTTVRVINVCRIITKMLHTKSHVGKLTKRETKCCTMFLKMSLDFRKKLLLNPFTEKQFIKLFEVERILGIYWSDKSPEFNGEVWRKTVVEKLQKERVNNG